MRSWSRWSGSRLELARRGGQANIEDVERIQVALRRGGHLDRRAPASRSPAPPESRVGIGLPAAERDSARPASSAGSEVKSSAGFCTTFASQPMRSFVSAFAASRKLDARFVGQRPLVGEAGAVHVRSNVFAVSPNPHELRTGVRIVRRRRRRRRGTRDGEKRRTRRRRRRQDEASWSDSTACHATYS